MTYDELPSLEEFGPILDQLSLAQIAQIVETNQQIKDEEMAQAWSEIWHVQHPEFYDPRYYYLEEAALKSYRKKINAAFKVSSKSINRVGRARGKALAGAWGAVIDQVIYLILARDYQIIISKANAKTFLAAWQPILNNLPK